VVLGRLGGVRRRKMKGRLGFSIRLAMSERAADKNGWNKGIERKIRPAGRDLVPELGPTIVVFSDTGVPTDHVTRGAR